jgi:uncharacterized protein DUF3667
VRRGEGAATWSCTNCHEQLLNGRYCSKCGQRHEPHIHSLREFLSEATEVITHADSRLWRTLAPLLFRPGFLTREFLRGRRARYLPPFRLYIVASVIFFLIASTGVHKAAFLQVGTEDGVPKSFKVDVAQLDALEKLQPVVAPKGAAPADPDETPEDRDGDAHEPPAKEPTPQERVASVCGGNGNFAFGLPLAPRVQEACRKIVIDKGHGLAEAMFHNLPRALIILIQLLALVMRLMYWRRSYVEHLLFFVHNHAFTFLFLSIYTLTIRLVTADLFGINKLLGSVSGWLVGIMTTAMVLYVLYYTYRAMLRVYGQGKWLTRLKFTALAFAYIICVSVMGVAMSLYTMITL